MKLIHTLLLSFFVTTFYGQNQYLVGTVVDAQTQETLIGANVSYDLGNTITDTNGNYSIRTNQKSLAVTISYLGYITESFVHNSGENNQYIKLSPTTTILDQMTVTASKYEQRVSESTVSIEVLQSDYISSTNAASAEDVLDKVPGVQMVDGQANIRGGSGFSYGAGSRVLLLVDDMPALQVDAGFPNWNDLPIEATEQVEIVKGAASSLYGSSALNGIINLRRIKPGIKPRTELAVSATTYSDPSDPNDYGKKWYNDDNRPSGKQVSAMHAQKFGEVDLMVHGLYRKLDSWNKDTYEDRYRMGFTSSYRLNDSWLLSLSSVFNKLDNSSFFIWNNALNGIYTPFTNSITKSNSMRYYIDPSIKYFSDNGDEHTLRTRYSRVDNDNNNNQGNTSDTYFGEYQYQTTLPGEIKFVGGVVLMSGSSDSELFGDTTFVAKNNAVYGQVEKSVGKLGVTAGARYEYNEQQTPEIFNGIEIPDGRISDGEMISRLGLNYKLAKYSNIRASFGQGYRFPTITERFIVTTFSSFTIYPNPDLSPEKGWTTEIGMKQGVRVFGLEGYLDASFFCQRYQDMTEFTIITEPALGFQSQNVGNTTIKGFEFSLVGKANIGPVPIRVFGGYTYIDPTYDDFNQELQISSSSDENVLKYRTKHNAKVDVEASFKSATIGLAYNRTSHMIAIDSAFELLGPPQIGAYRSINNQGNNILNLRASYEWKTLKLSFLIDNFNNLEYTQRPGKLEAPRSMTLRLDYRVNN
ncbi:MAG TPA: hypothetical protein DGP89_07270 [Saprospirales bacterium]|nr:hypothetical protein [Saprospirales bacterium]